MAQQTINTGTTANDNTGDTLRSSWQKANDNFTELYGAVPLVSPTAWTPIMTDSGGGRIFSTTVNAARHTSIGVVTTFTLDMTVNSVAGSASGNLRITLPDAVAYDSALSVWLTNGTNQAKTALVGKAIGGTSYCEIGIYETGSTSSIAAHLQATSRIVVSGVYFAS